MDKTQPVTQAMIAKRLGVSQKTVSKALHGRQSISEDLQKKILDQAQEMGYRVNRIASSLRGKKLRLIGILHPTYSDDFTLQIINAALSEINQRQFKAMLSPWQEGKVIDDAYELEAFLEYNVDGILAMPRTVRPWNETIYAKLADKGLPLVTIDKNIGIDGIGSVTSDNRQGISQAIRHLVDYGHRRFAYVGPKYPYYTSETDRYNAFFKEVTEANISLSNLFFIDSKQISSELPELLQKRKFPTAFCCFSDYVSLAVLDVVEKLGLKIPDDLSITGYGNAIPKIEYHRVPLTTVSQSPAIIGKEAAKMILSIIEDRAKPYDLRIPTHLIPRGSTGPVNKAKTDKKNPKGRR